MVVMGELAEEVEEGFSSIFPNFPPAALNSPELPDSALGCSEPIGDARSEYPPLIGCSSDPLIGWSEDEEDESGLDRDVVSDLEALDIGLAMIPESSELATVIP